MAAAALVVSIVSALTALTTVTLTLIMRRDAARAAEVTLRMLVTKKQVFRDQALTTWTIHGVQQSVYDLNDDLSRLLPTLKPPARQTCETLIELCSSYLMDLRPSVAQPDGPPNTTLIRRHGAWADAMRTTIGGAV